MRVTQLEVSRNLLTDLEKLNRNFVDVDRQLSTGKKLNYLGDSPLGSADLVDITEHALRLDAYRFNITNSTNQLKSAESVLNLANNAFVSIHTLGVQAATETLNDEARKAILNEMEKLREELLSIGNSKVDGRYLFAGSKIEDAPFELVETSPGSDLFNVVYKGNNNVISVPVGDGVEVVAGVSGEKALGAVFKKVDDLIEAISNSITGLGTVEGIGTALGGYNEALNELGQARGQLGVSLSMVERLSEMINVRDGVLKEQRSSIEDANILDVTVRITLLRTAISAALSAGGAVLQQNSLFDTIG